MKLIIYDLQVEFLPGKFMFYVDLLSRHFFVIKKENLTDFEGMIHAIHCKNIHVTDIAKGTIKYVELSEVGFKNIYKWLA